MPASIAAFATAGRNPQDQALVERRGYQIIRAEQMRDAAIGTRDHV